MAVEYQPSDSGPVRETSRIVSLDLIRGVAVLGILLMNAVYFKFGPAPYFNLSAGGSETWLDWAVGIFGEVFVDQKFMGLFSMLFGAGMILFIDRRQGTRQARSAAEPVAKRVAAPDRHPPLPVVGRRRAGGLCRIVGLLDSPAEIAKSGAHLSGSYSFRPICWLRPSCAAHRRHGYPIRVRPLGSGRDFG